MLLLGGSQGLLGWYMVKSGLTERTDVSHFRLSAHLLLALFIMAALIWTALDLKRLGKDRREPPCPPDPCQRLSRRVILFVQLLLGAWVAGLNAGYVASDWPLMQGKLYPDGVDWSEGVASRAHQRPLLAPFHPPLVGLGGGRGAGRLRAPDQARSIRALRRPSTSRSAPRSCSASRPS